MSSSRQTLPNQDGEFRTQGSHIHQQHLSLSIGYSSHRSSRASVPHQGLLHTKEHLDILANHSKPDDQAMAIEILVEIFYKTNLSGPHVFIDDNEILGRGGQFVVYKQRIAIPLEDSFTTQLVAFKVPKYPQDSKTPFRLFTAEAKRHIRHIYLEILALSNPSLRGHPNIADLLGWSYGDGLHTTVGLVMELAQSDLLVFLHDKDHNDISPLVKYNLCRGIAAGLDALHGCGLIHGDLKPENVLLFRSKNGAFIAKLADFGLSIYEEEGMSGVQIIGGTPGWQAPEVEKGERIDSQFLYRTDYYSFGLLVWSMFVHGGNKPPSNSRGSRNEIALSEIDQVLSHTGENMYHNLRNLLEHLLQDCPLQRFMPVGSLSNHTEEVLDQLSEALKETNLSSVSDLSDLEDDYAYNNPDTEGYYSWEPPSLPVMFVQEIYSRLLQDPEEVPVGTLFSTFLLLTAKPEINNLPSSAPLNTLFIAAVRGSESARGVVSRVLEYYDTLPQDEVRNHFADWLRRSAATGSLIAKEELNRVDPTILLSCLEYFRQMGGYARHYDPIDPQKEGPLEDYIPSPGDYPLHWLATYGSFEVLIYMLDSQGPYEINAMNDAGATPLYNACARGSWKIAQALLDHGADASIQCTSIGITCLHWLFAFDEHDQEHACSRLVSAGADVDAMTALITPFLHYPFVLPLGSSLHWAVVLGAQTTVKVLIQAGANVLLRNDGDHYVYDGRVRVLDKWAANQEAYSVPLHKVEGLCPLDYAAMNHDPFIFEFLVCSGRHVNINAVDEEGFSVLHRLSTAPSRETRTGVEFSHLVFQGRPAVVEQRIARTIAAIKILGGDLELITKSPRAVTEAGTPLMMAALGQCPVVVKALLEAGANVETRNESGLSALMCLSLEDKEAASENMRTLVSFGADIHHSTKDGLTPVILAARAKLEDVVDLLLSRGVDIDTRAPETADNLFACLADEDDEEHDHAIAALLDKYVFNCLDAAKRQRVIEYVNIDGETLLHKYAACGMQHCIEALIANGAPVNASKYEYMRETQEETLFKVFWQETPLDVALVEKERRLRDLKRDSQYTLKKIEERCRKIDVVIEILEKAGGLQKAGEKQKQPLMFDFEDYGGSRYKNYLRDA